MSQSRVALCCGRFIASWRSWIRQVIMAAYIIVFLCCITAMLVGINSFDLGKFQSANFLAGIAMAFTIPISLWGILQHAVNYTNPALQKYIIRVLWMVPIYSVLSFLGLHLPSQSVKLDAVKDCYEAFVVYSFTCFLVKYLQQACPNLDYPSKRAVHIIPCCCIPAWKSHDSIVNSTIGVLQYTLVKPILTVITVVTSMLGKYHEGVWSAKYSWIYVMVITNISQGWALYCLVLFYQTFKTELLASRPVPKFLSIKLVVFATWWQSLGISILVRFTKLSDIPWIDENAKNDAEISHAIQDFLVCFEMLLAAIAHYYAFSHREFRDETVIKPGMVQAFKQMVDISDVGSDFVTHGHIVRDRMKRRITKKYGDPENENFYPVNQGDYLAASANDSDAILTVEDEPTNTTRNESISNSQQSSPVKTAAAAAPTKIAPTSDTNLLV